MKLTERDGGRRERNVGTVHDYYRLQEDMNLDAWIELWAVTGKQVIPYAPDGFPTLVSGRAELMRIYDGLFNGFSMLEIRDLRVDAMDDPERVLARWHTHATLTEGGTYDNDLIGLFEFDEDGKIELFTEYFDPTRFGH